MAQAVNLDVTQWDIEETSRGGPFLEILEYDLFINCVLVQKKIPPFVTLESLSVENRKLSVISDISCDPGENNPIPIYTETTSFSAPAMKVIDNERPLYLCAIDNLPSLLPVEASEDFGQQLLSHLLMLKDNMNDVWQGALRHFHEKCRDIH